MSDPTSPDLSSLRIDRGARGGRRRRRNPWLGRLVWLVAIAGGIWLFQRPLRGWVDRLRLPEVELAPLVRTTPSSASGAQGAASNGYVIARTRAALSAEQPGRVVAMNVVEGTRLSKGEVVARVDSSEQEARLEVARAGVQFALAGAERAIADRAAAQADRARAAQDVPVAEASLASARASLRFAQVERARVDRLVEDRVAEVRQLDAAVRDEELAEAAFAGAEAGVGSARAALDAADAWVEAARKAEVEATASVASAQAAVEEAEAALEKTFVRAPFDGVVVLKEAEVGEVVSPNSQGGSNARGSVATMVDFASLEVQAEVPETTIAAVRAGGPAKIYLDAYPSEPYDGRIDRIWPTADRTKATVEVRVAFAAADDRLRPDMGVRVVFLDEEPAAGDASDEPVLLAPSRAIVTVDGRRGVFVVERDRVRFQPATFGDSLGTRVRVEGGLGGDELVVLDPAADLAEGQRVRVKE